jgi:Family of unknown function (DUF6455)
MNNAIDEEHVTMAQTVDNPRYSDLGRIFEAIADWIDRYRKAYAAHNELINCGTDEVARIAYDLGISSDDLLNLASKGAKSADLLQKMLVALGVDPKNFANVDPTAMHDLQRLCVNCWQKQRCAHELEVGTAAENYREFCPNNYTLGALFKTTN